MVASASDTFTKRGAMAKKKAAARKKSRPAASRPRRSESVSRRRTAKTDPLLADIKNSERRDVGGVRLDTVRAGEARVKRMVYPAGFRWSKHMKPISGTDLCMHAHVGFIARGSIHIDYADGTKVEFVAPQAVAIEPGHDGYVVGDEPAVLIEVDFEGQTAERFGMTTPRRKSR